jgi:predicted CoA-binding protein
MRVPTDVAEFLAGKRFAVAGVSRQPGQPANAVFRKLRDSGYEVVPINPGASELEGTRCYPDLSQVSGPIDGVVIATHPNISASVVRQCSSRGIGRVWFHRSFGQGSVSHEALEECKALGVKCVVGGCPLMYCDPIDFGHRCMRWWLNTKGRVPG